MTLSEKAKDFLLTMWLMCRVTPEDIEAAYQNGKLTEQERDEILNTPRNCD